MKLSQCDPMTSCTTMAKQSPVMREKAEHVLGTVREVLVLAHEIDEKLFCQRPCECEAQKSGGNDNTMEYYIDELNDVTRKIRDVLMDIHKNL